MKQDNNRICPGNRLTLVVIQARMMSQWAVKSSVNGSYLCSALVTEKEIISRGESLRITDALFPLQSGVQRACGPAFKVSSPTRTNRTDFLSFLQRCLTEQTGFDAICTSFDL